MLLMLNEFLPHYDVHEVHQVSSSAPPSALLNAVRDLTPGEVPLLVGLMAIRSLPARLRGRSLWTPETIIGGFHRIGFVLLHDSPDEIVFGAVGRFWQTAGGFKRIDASEFREFTESGWAKTAFNFRVERRDGDTLLTTETRVLGTDAQARRRFRRYWRLIRPGSAAIRVAWLRAIKRRAES
ncbi:MAG: hypothetical protein ACREA0_06845 [bacterium]